jgi:hypothetical protein
VRDWFQAFAFKWVNLYRYASDAIPQSGLYDGCLGVIGPIEAIASLQRAGFKPKRSIEVLMFTSEEPTRFGISCVGGGWLPPFTTPFAATKQQLTTVGRSE